MILMMIFAFILTAFILMKNRFYDRFYANRYKFYTNLVVGHMIDEEEIVLVPDILTRPIVRDVIIDLLFITKGQSVGTLKKLYHSFGFYAEDIQNLSHRAWHKRLAAVVRLDQWKNPDQHTGLVRLMDDENKDVRIHAMKALSLSVDPLVAQEILGHIIRTRIDLSIRYECLSRLLKNHRQLILSTLKDEKWMELHPHIIKVLGDQRDILATPFIMDAVKEEDTSVKEHVYLALGKIGDPRGISVLLSGLESSAGTERLAAIKSIHQIDEALFRKYEDQFLRDPDPLVRAWTKHLGRGATP